MEVLRRRASGMDATRGITGQGWPVYADLRSSAGRREVWPQVRPVCRARFLFGYFLFARAKRK